MTTYPVDRIRIWDDRVGIMLAPVSLPQLLQHEWDCGYVGGLHGVRKPSDDPDEYAHLTFMRNTGIYDQTLALKNIGSSIEIFAGDLITQGTEKHLYRVMSERGCWLALPMRIEGPPARRLIDTWNPRIVGNVFETPDMALKGTLEIDECDTEV
jgi:hypothetical protein